VTQTGNDKHKVCPHSPAFLKCRRHIILAGVEPCLMPRSRAFAHLAWMLQLQCPGLHIHTFFPVLSDGLVGDTHEWIKPGPHALATN